MRVLIVIPAYNEEDNIVSVVNEVIKAGYDYLVINDGSKDATLDICHKNNFSVLNIKNNLGIGGAVQAGHKYAYQNGYDVSVQFDGDGQHDVAHVSKLIKLLSEKKADLVIGSRYLSQTDGFQSTFMRRVGKSWLSGLIKLFSGVRVTDPTSGFRASGSKALRLFSNDYPIDYPEPESIITAVKSGLTVEEVPVTMRERQGGKSSIGILSSAYYMIKVSLSIAILSFFGRFDKE
jgi:glycosyltransferase involved in cell wall biosynthesis